MAAEPHQRVAAESHQAVAAAAQRLQTAAAAAAQRLQAAAAAAAERLRVAAVRRRVARRAWCRGVCWSPIGGHLQNDTSNVVTLTIQHQKVVTLTQKHRNPLGAFEVWDRKSVRMHG